MLESIIKNYDELPLFLNAKNLSKVLGLSESSVYELMHEKSFPSICIGSRLVVLSRLRRKIGNDEFSIRKRDKAAWLAAHNIARQRRSREISGMFQAF